MQKRNCMRYLLRPIFGTTDIALLPMPFNVHLYLSSFGSRSSSSTSHSHTNAFAYDDYTYSSSQMSKQPTANQGPRKKCCVDVDSIMSSTASAS